MVSSIHPHVREDVGLKDVPPTGVVHHGVEVKFERDVVSIADVMPSQPRIMMIRDVRPMAVKLARHIV